MKCTPKNVELVFNTIQSQIEDENGRGEFDNESKIEDAVEKVIEWIESDGSIDYDK